MPPRKLLTASLAAFCTIGVVFAALPFINSFSPSAGAINAHEKHIPLSSLPTTGFVEIEWNGSKVFLQSAGDVRAYLMPFHEKGYLLPDPTWDRAWIPCRTFAFNEGLFQCLDSELPESLRHQARWNDRGQNITESYSPMLSPDFVVTAGTIVLGRKPIVR